MGRHRLTSTTDHTTSCKKSLQSSARRMRSGRDIMLSLPNHLRLRLHLPPRRPGAALLLPSAGNQARRRTVLQLLLPRRRRRDLRPLPLRHQHRRHAQPRNRLLPLRRLLQLHLSPRRRSRRLLRWHQRLLLPRMLLDRPSRARKRRHQQATRRHLGSPRSRR